ncbi:hypothetical protein CANCADRAFT_17690, partial [Tortispora caseinolytica NRRL Y-17796]
ALLGIIIDVNGAQWARIRDQVDFRRIISSLLVFVNAHLALKESNKVLVVSCGPHKSKILYPASESTDSANIEADGQMYRPFQVVNQVIIDAMMNSLEESQSSSSNSVKFAGALSMALSYANKLSSHSIGHGGYQSRILAISVSEDEPSQYIACMNAMFTAQKLSIPVDVCKLNGNSVFLEQIADATSGTFLRPDHPSGILQYLMSVYSPNPSIRNYLALPSQSNVDFRASCFCHQKVVSIGYVCSVCLSVYCSVPSTQSCMVCGSKYDPEEIAKLFIKPQVIPIKKPK